MKKFPITVVVFCCTIALLVVSLQAQEFRYEKTIQKYEKESKENPPKDGCSMFIGSSSWRLWGKQLEEDFKEFDAVNRGFGGATIPELTFVMDRLYSPYKLKRVFFFCGGNDVARGAQPEQVFEDFKTFLSRLREKNPDTMVYFLSISRSPVREKSWEKTGKVNDMVRELAQKDEKLTYIDTLEAMQAFMDAGGDPWLEDRLHLNREGQKIWIRQIKTTLEAEAKNDQDTEKE